MRHHSPHVLDPLGYPLLGDVLGLSALPVLLEARLTGFPVLMGLDPIVLDPMLGSLTGLTTSTGYALGILVGQVAGNRLLSTALRAGHRILSGLVLYVEATILMISQATRKVK